MNVTAILLGLIDFQIRGEENLLCDYRKISKTVLIVIDLDFLRVKRVKWELHCILWLHFFGSIGMGWWSLGWGCCVVRVELVCWRLIWFQCYYLVMGLVMLCSLVSFLWWLVCRGDVGWWSWCCDSRDCGGLRVELKLAWLWLWLGYWVLMRGYVFRCDLNGG